MLELLSLPLVLEAVQPVLELQLLPLVLEAVQPVLELQLLPLVLEAVQPLLELLSLPLVLEAVQPVLWLVPGGAFGGGAPAARQGATCGWPRFLAAAINTAAFMLSTNHSRKSTSGAPAGGNTDWAIQPIFNPMIIPIWAIQPIYPFDLAFQPMFLKGFAALVFCMYFLNSKTILLLSHEWF